MDDQQGEPGGEFCEEKKKSSNFSYGLVFLYIESGRSILRFFFLADLTCLVTFMQTSSSKVTHTKMKANCNRLKYKETAENTKKAKMTSSQMTKTTTSTLPQTK